MLYPNELQAHILFIKNGRGRGIRTPDILLPKQARYQTALYPVVCMLTETRIFFRRRMILIPLFIVKHTRNNCYNDAEFPLYMS